MSFVEAKTMGKKSNLIIDIIAAVFKLTVSVALIVFALIVGVIKVLFFAFKPRGNIKSSRQKNSRPTWEDFKYTGETSKESFNNYLASLGVPPKPTWKQFRYTGQTYEQTQDNYHSALDEWHAKYDILVYGHKLENETDEDYED